MSKRNNIILIGFMGSGKTTFGKWIAANKKMEFVDTDELIEKENGITISDIFASKGEVYFRNLETDMLNKLLERDYPKLCYICRRRSSCKRGEQRAFITAWYSCISVG